MVESDIFFRLKDGDIAAFESLYKTYYAVLCKLAKTITHSHELAEEIVDDLSLDHKSRRQHREV